MKEKNMHFKWCNTIEYKEASDSNQKPGMWNLVPNPFYTSKIEFTFPHTEKKGKNKPTPIFLASPNPKILYINKEKQNRKIGK